MQGWIKTHRQMLGSAVFNNPDLLKVWMWCLLKASHKEHIQLVGYQEQKLNPGDLIFGRKKASVELGYSESKTYRLIKRLEQLQNVTIKTNNKYSIVSIVNWELYQGNGVESEQQNEQQMNNKRTTNEQQMNTNKNVENAKNENTNKYSTSVRKILPLYPGKKTKSVRDKRLPKILKEHGEEEITRAVKRYASEVTNVEKQFILNESTFWNGRYVDYLDDNYQPSQEEQPRKYTIGSDRLL